MQNPAPDGCRRTLSPIHYSQWTLRQAPFAAEAGRRPRRRDGVVETYHVGRLRMGIARSGPDTSARGGTPKAPGSCLRAGRHLEPGWKVGDHGAALAARLPLSGGCVAVWGRATTHYGYGSWVSWGGDTATLPQRSDGPNQRPPAPQGPLRRPSSETILGGAFRSKTTRRKRHSGLETMAPSSIKAASLPGPAALRIKGTPATGSFPGAPSFVSQARRVRWRDCPREPRTKPRW
jgi:hypothetical protein